jgi:hypothetical protein
MLLTDINNTLLSIDRRLSAIEKDLGLDTDDGFNFHLNPPGTFLNAESAAANKMATGGTAQPHEQFSPAPRGERVAADCSSWAVVSAEREERARPHKPSESCEIPF